MKNKFKEWFYLICSIIFNNNKSKILFYHDIYKTVNYKASDADIHMGTHLDLFKKHIEIIHQEGYKIVPSITKPNSQIIIMLDDGFRGIYECRQFFYEKKIFPTIFLAVDLIGKPGFLTKEEIIELQNNGFNFECHSWSHRNLTEFSKTDLKKELLSSKEYLSSLLGKSIESICLPIGYYNANVIQEIKRYNYQKIYSSIPGNYYDKLDYNMIPRNLVQFSSPKEVKYILRGGNRLLKLIYKKSHCKNN